MNKEIIYEKIECHGCGKVDTPRIIVELDYLCQHFLQLCSCCYEELKETLNA